MGRRAGIEPLQQIGGRGIGPKRAEREAAALGPFIDNYLDKRTDIKPRTRINLQQVQRNLVAFFGTNRPMADITEGDAEEWRSWFSSIEEKLDGKIIKSKLGPNTVRRQCGRARQLFRNAMNDG